MDDTQIAIGVITDNGDTGAIQIFTYDGTEWLLQHHVVPGGGVSGDCAIAKKGKARAAKARWIDRFMIGEGGEITVRL